MLYDQSIQIGFLSFETLLADEIGRRTATLINAAGIIPITNPTSTMIFKGLLAIKTRNAICFSPHPSAVKVCAQTMVLIARNVVHSIILNDNAISLVLVFVHLYVDEFTSRVLSVGLMHSLNQFFCFR